jgi:hypothetical protein
VAPSVAPSGRGPGRPVRLLRTVRFSGRTYPKLRRIVRVLCAVAGRWRLPLVAAVAVTVAVNPAQAPPVASRPAPYRGWPASGPGRLRPGPWFLTGVSVEAPGSSVTSRVRSPSIFHLCSRRPAVTVTLEAGGADADTQRAIPGTEPSQDPCTFRSWCQWPSPARTSDPNPAAAGLGDIRAGIGRCFRSAAWLADLRRDGRLFWFGDGGFGRWPGEPLR